MLRSDVESSEDEEDVDDAPVDEDDRMEDCSPVVRGGGARKKDKISGNFWRDYMLNPRGNESDEEHFSVGGGSTASKICFDDQEEPRSRSKRQQAAAPKASQARPPSRAVGVNDDGDPINAKGDPLNKKGETITCPRCLKTHKGNNSHGDFLKKGYICFDDLEKRAEILRKGKRKKTGLEISTSSVEEKAAGAVAAASKRAASKGKRAESKEKRGAASKEKAVLKTGGKSNKKSKDYPTYKEEGKTYEQFVGHPGETWAEEAEDPRRNGRRRLAVGAAASSSQQTEQTGFRLNDTAGRAVRWGGNVFSEDKRKPPRLKSPSQNILDESSLVDQNNISCIHSSDGGSSFTPGLLVAKNPRRHQAFQKTTASFGVTGDMGIGYPNNQQQPKTKKQPRRSGAPPPAASGAPAASSSRGRTADGPPDEGKLQSAAFAPFVPGGEISKIVLKSPPLTSLFDAGKHALESSPPLNTPSSQKHTPHGPPQKKIRPRSAPPSPVYMDVDLDNTTKDGSVPSASAASELVLRPVSAGGRSNFGGVDPRAEGLLYLGTSQHHRDDDLDVEELESPPESRSPVVVMEGDPPSDVLQRERPANRTPNIVPPAGTGILNKNENIEESASEDYPFGGLVGRREAPAPPIIPESSVAPRPAKLTNLNPNYLAI